MKTLNHLNSNRFVNAVSILLFLFSFSAYSQPSDVPYEFPVKSGTPEWAKLQSHSDMLNACQVPVGDLKRMSTKALLTTCLNYPLFGDVFAYNDFQLGFERVLENFNGIKELMQRPDVGETALQEYITLESFGSPEARDFSEKWRYRYLEIILSQSQVSGNLPVQKKKQLLNETLKKFSAKQQKTDIYGPFSLTTSCIVMARMLRGKVNSGNQDLDLKISRFTEKPFTANVEIINAIIKAANRYLNN